MLEGSPRILVTGFSSFPGVPANPTEALVEALRGDPELLALPAQVHLKTLPVEYRTLSARLEALGREVRPDIAVHFGVSGRATAFVLEATARNAVCTQRPDNSGHVPAEAFVRQDGGVIASSLPLARIRAALAERHLPAVFSDDAGDYLCNSLFYLSCGKHCPPFAPAFAGFIHVPPFGTLLAGTDRPFDLPALVKGAEVIASACVETWRFDTPSG